MPTNEEQTPEQVAAAAAAEAARLAAEGKKVYDETYVKTLRDENKKRREAAEALQAERDALQKKIDDREKAELEEQKKFKDLLDKERADREKERKELNDKLSAGDRRLILAEAKTVATAAGIIDVDDVSKAIDIADLRIDDAGNVPGLKEKIEALKTAKPHWFKSEKGPDGNRRPVTTPDRKDGGQSEGVDWSKKSRAEVAAELKKYGVN